MLAGTGSVLAGLGGPAAGAVGAVTLTGVPGVVTGLMPLAAAGALGILGKWDSLISLVLILSDVFLIRSIFHDVHRSDLLHYICWSVLWAAF